MVFSSTIFLFVFLPVTLAGYYLIRKELRNSFLLIMSLLFYASGEPSFVWVMMGSILANYLLGLMIWKFSQKGKQIRILLLVLTLCVNLGILFYYKYFDFAVSNVNKLLGTEIPLRHIALPIGISFFTFQGMSYVLDVFMGSTPVQKNPLNVALYIALFPQLIAGPIVRYSDVNLEIESRKENLTDFASGVQRFSVGLAKKVVLSNSFALLADKAFQTAPSELSAGLAWLGAFAYAFQIYFDFSGYSDMAIGLGRMFGFHFRENFDYPYTATNVSVFWRKWHISLSSWFRDYVYIPLGGNRRGNVYLNLLTVFFLTGLWHGASWNFIIWGLWHGFFLIVERIFRNHKIVLPIPKIFKWCYTMLVVLVGWVFFRAADLTAAVQYLACMVNFTSDNAFSIQVLFYAKEYLFSFFVAIVCSTPILCTVNRICNENRVLGIIKSVSEPIVAFLLILISVGLLSISNYNPFIYFNF